MLNRLKIAMLVLIICISLTSCSSTVDYERYALSFMQVTSTERYEANKDWLLANTSDKLKDEIDTFLYSSNFSNTMQVSIIKSNVQIAGNTIKAMYIMECQAADYGYLSATSFTFTDNLLTDYKVITLGAM